MKHPLWHCKALSAGDLTGVRVDAIGTLIRRSVLQGAALGWVDPPDAGEIRSLLASVAEDVRNHDAAAVVVEPPESSPEHSRARAHCTVLGFGFWRRYTRPTHRPQADLPVLVVDSALRRQGVGAAILDALLNVARSSGVEQLTLDARGDNTAAHELWLSRGFKEYGRLRDFVAVGDQRYDKTLWVRDLRT